MHHTRLAGHLLKVVWSNIAPHNAQQARRAEAWRAVAPHNLAKAHFYTPDAQGDRYCQVSLSAMDDSTLAREPRPLQSIDDDHPKTLLTMDRIGTDDHAGIKQINIIEWLLS